MLGLQRGTKSPSEMVARQPGEQAVIEAVPEAAGRWPGQRCWPGPRWSRVCSCQVWKKGWQDWDTKGNHQGHGRQLRRHWRRMS